MTKLVKLFNLMNTVANDNAGCWAFDHAVEPKGTNGIEYTYRRSSTLNRLDFKISHC